MYKHNIKTLVLCLLNLVLLCLNDIPPVIIDIIS